MPHIRKVLIAYFLLIFSLIVCVRAQNNHDIDKHGKLIVSPSHRYIKYEDGTPFFWLGDTGWELFHRLKKSEVETYFQTRSSQGFTVIQAVVLAEFDGLHTPNAYGDLPLKNDDPLQPVESYFQFVDWVIDRAKDFGLHIALLPTWGDKLYKNTWGVGPEIFNISNAAKYGEWIGNRYKDKKNVIWILGGDRIPRNDSDVNVWRAMAKGIISGCGGENNALMSFHPQPSSTCSSSGWFHKDSWLDFNMQQTGHCDDAPVWKFIGDDYGLNPTKPVIDGEAVYEDHPLCFNAKEKGYTQAFNIRQAAYYSIFAGGFGYTYGCHAIWQFYSPERAPVNGPLRYWYVSMDLPGARQMKYLRNLMETFPEQDRIPNQKILTDTLDGNLRIQALSGKDFIMVYSGWGKSFSIQLGKINGRKLSAWWYDPRTGAKIPIGELENNGIIKFIPYTSGKDNDWILVLYDSGKKYFESRG